MPAPLALPHCLSTANSEIDNRLVKNKTVLYQHGEIVRHIWIIKRGFVKIHRTSPQGRPVTLSLLGTNAMFGAIDCDQRLANETTTTQSSAELIRIVRSQFDFLLKNHSDFSMFVARSLFMRKEALQQRLYSVMHRKVEARIAALLGDLAQNEGERCTHGAQIDVRLGQQDIADMVGASRQVVSAQLNRLRQRDLVHYSRNLICVTNLAGLLVLAEN